MNNVKLIISSHNKTVISKSANPDKDPDWLRVRKNSLHMHKTSRTRPELSILGAIKPCKRGVASGDENVECCVIQWTFDCRDSLLWTVADKSFHLKLEVDVNGI